jgi:hypothetical protein
MTAQPTARPTASSAPKDGPRAIRRRDICKYNILYTNRLHFLCKCNSLKTVSCSHPRSAHPSVQRVRSQPRFARRIYPYRFPHKFGVFDGGRSDEPCGILPWRLPPPDRPAAHSPPAPPSGRSGRTCLTISELTLLPLRAPSRSTV